jgi:hypothetical protein
MANEVWKPGSFTKNFSWGDQGLLQLHEFIRLGFDGKVRDVPREVFRNRVSKTGRSDYIPINFFLFNKIIGGVDHLVADELVFQAITAPHTANFDHLALFALNFSYVGKWSGADVTQRRPALWAHHYIRDKVAKEYNWDVRRINARDIQSYVEGDPRYQAKSAGKLSTNLNYLYRIGHLSAFNDAKVSRWWVDALFLALDRLIEDQMLDGKTLTESQYSSALARSGFLTISGKSSLEKELASKHLVSLFAACGGRERFSEEYVRERTVLKIPDANWFIANDDRPRGAVHPSNPLILKSIPRACAMLAKYAGFEVIGPDELENFDIEDFIRTHTKTTLDRLKDRGITPTISIEELMKITRDK